MAAVSSFPATLVASALALAACTETPDDPTAAAQAPSTPVSSTPMPEPVATPARPALTPAVEPVQPSDCNAPKARPFVGRTADAATRADLASAVAPVAAIRWVGPGDATTEDYSPQRLNVMLDVAGKIVSVHCG